MHGGEKKKYDKALIEATSEKRGEKIEYDSAAIKYSTYTQPKYQKCLLFSNMAQAPSSPSLWRRIHWIQCFDRLNKTLW
jgi:hypothetical protein